LNNTSIESEGPLQGPDVFE